MELNLSIEVAASDQAFADGRSLFEQYALTLPFDLAFQDFSKELDQIATTYNAPVGTLILVYDGEQPIACLAVRRLEEGIAELKRMFVQPAYRGYQLGKQLLTQALAAAKKLQYQSIRLDTLPEMQSAINLYRAFGFYEIDPYRYNPREDAIYMEKRL